MTMQVADLIFVRLANVEHKDVVAGINAPLQFLRLDLPDVPSHRSRLTAHAAELLIIDQLGNGGIHAAYGALGIFAQFEFAETHAQRVNQQKTSDERIASAEDHLDCLRCLD